MSKLPLFITSALVLLAANSALASNPCPSLLAPPTAAELALSSEERVALLYSRLLTQYRGTVTEDEYVKFLETTLKDESYFVLNASSTSQYEMKAVFERISEMRAKETLPSGEKLKGLEIDKEIRKHLDTELRSVKRTIVEVESAIEDAGTVRIPFLEFTADDQKVVPLLEVGSDFKRAITRSYKEVLVWDLESGRVTRRIPGHNKTVKSINVSPDFKRVLSGDDDRILILWDLETGQTIHRMYAYNKEVKSVRVSPDFKRAISVHRDETLIVWDLETGKPLHKLRGHVEEVASVEVSSDFKHAISISEDRMIVWDLETGKKLEGFTGYGEGYSDVYVSKDFKRVIYTSNGSLIIRDLDIGKGHLPFINWKSKKLKGLNRKASVMSAKFTADSKMAVIATPNTLSVWDLETGKMLKMLNGHTDRINSVEVNSDFTRAISIGQDGLVIVWDLETGKDLGVFTKHTGGVMSLQVTHDFKRAITGDSNGKMILWDLRLMGITL